MIGYCGGAYGEAVVKGEGGSSKITKGESVVMPANLGEYSIENVGGGCKMLEITGKF